MTSRGTRYWNSGSIPLIGPDVLGGIIAEAADISVVISESGDILSVLVNPGHESHAKLDHWEGRNIREVLTVESVPKLETQLARFMEGDAPKKGIELNHLDTGLEFPVRYSFHTVGPDGTILMLGRDLRPIAEMQQALVNAQLALERDYETKRDYETRYRVLLDTAAEAILLVDIESGRVDEANHQAERLLGETSDNLKGSLLNKLVHSERKGDEVDRLLAGDSDLPRPLRVAAAGSRKTLLLDTRTFRSSGERMMLCRLTVEDGERPRTNESVTPHLSQLFKEGADAIVFSDETGRILSAGDAFASLVEVAQSSELQGRSLADFLGRGAIDLRVLTENARRVGQMRTYVTKIVTEYGSRVAVEISATWLSDPERPAIGFIIRDASRLDTVRTAASPVTDDSAGSVMELVGSATLKEIVSETTDVIEKMCIETAVELTNNNRVAAAEMLGLSRQSLYVKLRKYGLLSRDE